MRKRPLAIVIALLALAGLGYWIYEQSGDDESPTYRFASIERGNLESAVSATGALSAVTTVQVGTQVSGRIVAIHADFNDRVKKGQLIARIDPLLQEQAVREAAAGLDRAQAELEKAQLDNDRSVRLYASKVLTESDFANTRYALAVAKANLKTAQVTLERARQNLEYTSIHSPIDGIVVERNVDVGQTVAASMNTPQLFLIANDLSHMQILASVDESDIGFIKQDQPVRFTVQAYSDGHFNGNVQQVRLQSKTAENVVNYTVVVGVDNPDGRLLPGMTATLEFLTGSANNVLMVPNAALRFRPPPDVLAQARQRAGAAFAAGRNGRPDAGAEGTQHGGPRTQNGGPGSGSILWRVDQSGELVPMRVRTGITDGQRTQVSGDDLEPDMQVVVGMVQSEPTASTNPFQPAQPARGGAARVRPGNF